MWTRPIILRVLPLLLVAAVGAWFHLYFVILAAALLIAVIVYRGRNAPR
jgi:hypothetical protein